MQTFLGVTGNLIGTHALALHADNRGSLIVIQHGNLHGERKAGGWLGIFLKEYTSRMCVYQVPIFFLAAFIETQHATSKATGEVAGKGCLPGNAAF